MGTKQTNRTALDDTQLRIVATEIAHRMGATRGRWATLWGDVKGVIAGVVVGVLVMLAGHQIGKAWSLSSARYAVMSEVMSIATERLESHYHRRQTAYVNPNLETDPTKSAKIRKDRSVPIEIAEALLLPHFGDILKDDSSRLSKAIAAARAADEKFGELTGAVNDTKVAELEATHTAAREALQELGRALAEATSNGG